MKFVNNSILIFLFIIIPSKNYCQNNTLNYENLVYYLEHYNIRHFPDSLWLAVIDKAFDEVKNGDSLIFKKLLKLSEEEWIILLPYISVDWAEFLTHYTELLIKLSKELSFEQIGVIATYSLSPGLISDWELEIIDKKIKTFLTSEDQKLVKVAKNYLYILKSSADYKF